MKKKVYLVRHGQTLFNRKELIQGWCDSPLTKLGHAQAKATGQYFKDKGVHFDKAYCSSLGRTEATLKDITDLPYERVDGLKEFNYGDLEGDSISKGCGAKNDLETYYKQFGGESKTEVEDRMEKTMKELAEKEGERILCVAHGACSYRFANRVDPKKAKKLRKFSNCLIYEFDYDTETGKFELKDIVDEHVRGLKEPEEIILEEKPVPEK